MGPARFHCATLLSILYYSDPQLASEQPADMSDETKQKDFVRSGIRTHAHRSGLRPERSALDLSAILTRYSNIINAYEP